MRLFHDGGRKYWLVPGWWSAGTVPPILVVVLSPAPGDFLTVLSIVISTHGRLQENPLQVTGALFLCSFLFVDTLSYRWELPWAPRSLWDALGPVWVSLCWAVAWKLHSSRNTWQAVSGITVFTACGPEHEPCCFPWSSVFRLFSAGE